MVEVQPRQSLPHQPLMRISRRASRFVHAERPLTSLAIVLLGAFFVSLPLAVAGAVVVAAVQAHWRRRRGGPPDVNWEGVFPLCDARATTTVAYPGNVDDVVAVVREARAAGACVKGVGAGHSWSNAARPDSRERPTVLLSLDRMKALVHVDQKRKIVTAEAGMRLVELIEALAAKGLALEVLPSVKEQSLAGLIATGTHGTGRAFQSLSNLVTALQLVTGTGEVLDIEGGELFDAARLHLGALGIVTRVSMRVVKLYNLHEVKYQLDYTTWSAKALDIVAANEHVKFWLEPHSGTVMVYESNRTKDAVRGNRPGWVENVEISAFCVAQWLLSFAPSLIPAGIALIVRLMSTGERVARGDHVQVIPFDVPRHAENEIAVPADRAVEALDILRRQVRERGLAVGHLVEIRFVKADRLMMSNSYACDTCQITLMMAYRDFDAVIEPYFAAYESELRDRMQARPHWGKHFYADGKQLRAVLPKYDDFVRIRDRLDPGRVFSNDFTRQVLPEGIPAKF